MVLIDQIFPEILPEGDDGGSVGDWIAAPSETERRIGVHMELWAALRKARAGFALGGEYQATLDGRSD